MAFEHFKRIERQIHEWILTPVHGTTNEPDAAQISVDDEGGVEEEYIDEVEFSDEGEDEDEDETPPYQAWTNESQKLAVWKLFLSVRVAACTHQYSSEYFPGK